MYCAITVEFDGVITEMRYCCGCLIKLEKKDYLLGYSDKNIVNSVQQKSRF